MAIKIMIADDHSMIREGLKSLLELEGDIQVVAEAEDGVDCLEKLKICTPDVLLLDINMPRKNGLEVLQTLKSSKSKVKILVLTVHNEVEYLMKAVDIGAQNYHIAMKYVAPIRKELGIRTVFNILGPLSNPAGANMELMGVFDQSLVEPLAQVMMKLGVNRGMVVFGQDKLDEISMSAPTSVCEIKDGWFQSYEITPEQFGYTRCSKEELAGGTPAENAEITKAIVNGTEKGPKRQAVCMNAGAALYIAGKAESLEAGVKMAENLIDSGAAAAKLEEFIRLSNEI